MMAMNRTQSSWALWGLTVLVCGMIGEGGFSLFSSLDLKDLHHDFNGNLVNNSIKNTFNIKHHKWVQRIESNGLEIFQVTWFFRDLKTLSERFLDEKCQVVTFIVASEGQPLGISSCLWSTKAGKECSSNCKLPLGNPNSTISGYLEFLSSVLNHSDYCAKVTFYFNEDESITNDNNDAKEFLLESVKFLYQNSSESSKILSNLRSLSTSTVIEDWQMSKPIRLFSSFGAPYDNFGTSLSMHDDVVAVGACSRDRGGFVYVFYRQGKTFYQDPYPLTGRPEYANDFFGWSVDVYERSIAVGAYQTTSLNEDMTSVGAVYVFLHLSSGWTVESFIRLTRTQQGGKNNNNNGNNAAPTYDNFGWSVSLFGNTLAVGAYGDDTVGMSAGAVYIFDRVNGAHFAWSQSQKLLAPDGSAYDSFGWSVSMNGNVTAVGAYSDSTDDFSYVGSVYVFRREHQMGGSGGSSVGRWSIMAKLVPADGGFNDFFGWDVSVFGNSLVVGSNSWQQTQSMNEVPTGAVYSYTLTYDFTGPMEQKEWVYEEKLRPPSGNTRYFGNTVSLDGENLLVGASGDKVASSTEAAYVYSASKSSKIVPSQFSGESIIIDKVQWTHRLLLSPNSTTDRSSDFGYSVAVWDGVCLVGALSATGASELSGAAFAFTRTIDKTARGHPVSETTYLALVSFLPLLFGAVFLMIGIAMVFLKPTDSEYMYDEAMDSSGLSDMSQSKAGSDGDKSVHSFTGLMGNARNSVVLGGGRIETLEVE